MKKHYYLLGSLFSLSVGLLDAAPLKRPVKQRPESVTTQPKGMITPAVAPKVKDGAGVIATGDFIWWKTNIGGMEYATSGVADGGVNVPFNTSVKRGHVSQPNFDFEPGFKLGLGLDFAHDGWDLYANYTWLNGDTEHNSLSAHRGNGASTLFGFADNFGLLGLSNISKESSSWRQHFNVIDLELGRNFFISRHLTLRPHFGLKSAWIDEKWKLEFKLSSFPDVIRQIRKQSLWGIGTRAGLNTVWHFSRNWGLYGDVDVTALWSDFHVKAKDRSKMPTFASSVSSTNLRTREVITEVIPVIEMGIGLTYMAWFNQDQYLFQISAGWEEQIWIDFNHFVDFSRSGNLSAQGLTIKAGFAF
jgi:hypothetical protein